MIPTASSARPLAAALFLYALAPLAACGTAADGGLQLRRVVLYQNGIGYFERSGELVGDRVRVPLREHEVGDVLKTLMVLDRATGRQHAISAVLPPQSEGKTEKNSYVELLLPEARAHALTIAYSVPTPVWKATYRLVLAGGGEDKSAPPVPAGGLFQAWALIDNQSDQAWQSINLTLATGAPLSFALDLRTPQYVARPDLTGHLVQPVALGAVHAERALPGDLDGDGVPDKDDLCPSEPEDRDGFEDQDGCPDPDNDKDRIPDKDDKCPNEPETYNGIDDDGCPDRGRVIVSHSRMEILDKIYFARGTDAIRPPSLPILEAIAATLKGNPQIRSIEIGGHASSDEPSAWDLSGRRAAAVQHWLQGRGVTTQIKLGIFGDSRPVAPNTSEDGRAKNRRIEFTILDRGDDAPRPSAPPRPSPPVPTEASPVQNAVPRDVAGVIRYDLTDPVTIPKGSQAMVSIVNQAGGTEDIYLYRPDSNVPSSDLHPLRAARLRSQFALEPGPVAVFARGSFVGEGMLQRLHPGETAIIPYALDSSSVVKVSRSSGELPVRLLRLHAGIATVENAEFEKTRYELTAAAGAPARLFVRHLRKAGYAAVGLPPESEESADAHLVPLPTAISKGGTSALEIEERKLVQRDLDLSESGSGDVDFTPYLPGRALSADVLQKVRALSTMYKRLLQLKQEVQQGRERLGEQAQRSAELRENLHSLEKLGGAAALQKELLGRLTESVQKSEQASKQVIKRVEEQAEAQTRLREALQTLDIPAPAPASPPKH